MKRRIAAISLTLALLMTLAMPAASNAATGDTTILGTVSSSISLIVPGTFSLELTPGLHATSTARVATVDTNATNWTLKVIEAGENPDGKMSGTAGTMKSPLTVKGGDMAEFLPLSSSVTLKTGSTAGSNVIDDIYFRQPVASDELAGSYEITVTFTAAVVVP
jgi:hypothetical protein